MPSFYQDRLGTNMGKALKTETRFPAARRFTSLRTTASRGAMRAGARAAHPGIATGSCIAGLSKCLSSSSKGQTDDDAINMAVVCQHCSDWHTRKRSTTVVPTMDSNHYPAGRERAPPPVVLTHKLHFIDPPPSVCLPLRRRTATSKHD
jgi:hypothetical protein